MSHHTYTYEDAEWRVNDCEGIAQVFDIPATAVMAARPFEPHTDMTQWHALMAALPDVQWGILRRQFAVYPVKWRAYKVEETIPLPDPSELAAACKVSTGEVLDALNAARSRWHGAVRSKAETPAMDDDEALALFGFDNAAVLADSRQSAYLARRIRDLLPVLQTADSRTQARAMLETERQMRYIVEPAISDMQALLDRMRLIQTERLAPSSKPLDKPITEEDRKERDINLIQMVKAITSLGEQLDTLIKRHGDMQKVILSTSEALGLSELQAVGGQEKLVYQRAISDLAKGCLDYHARGDRRLLDMMFAEDEIEILTAPYVDRPAQYRPDVVAHMRSVRDELFTGAALIVPPTRAVKRLVAGFRKGLAAALEEEGFEASALDDSASAAPEEGIAATPGMTPGIAHSAMLATPVNVPHQKPDDDEAA